MRTACLAILVMLAGCFAPEDGVGGGNGPATATLAVDFGGFRADDPQNLSHEITFQPDDPPTMEMYTSERPDGYTVHDLVADWADQTGTRVDVREHAAFGYVVQEIDGVVAHSSQGGSWLWALSVDGEATTEGMSTVVVEDGSRYAWTFEYRSR